MSTLKQLFNTLWRTDARLTALGLLMVGLLGAHAVAMLLDPRVISGAPAWLKPAKFSASIAIFTLTLAWVFTYLPEWVRLRRIVSWLNVLIFPLEVAIIDLQAWRGMTSHFNVGTPLDGALFTAMGLGIIVQTVSTVAVAVALFRQRIADPALAWAIRLGIVISIAGASTGGLMARPTDAQLAAARAGQRMMVVGAHTVGAPDGGPGLPGTGWSTEHGDVRVAHFVGLHALQVLPFLALVFARRGWNEASRVRVVWALSASYVALFGLLLWQALRGQSIANPDGLTIVAMASWVVLTACAIVVSGHRAHASGVHAVVY